MTQIDKLRFIRENISAEDILCQIAEEAAELTQAALKLKRKMEMRNPTPLDLESLKERLLGEIADVYVALDVLLASPDDLSSIDHKYEFKLGRWVMRLMEGERKEIENDLR